MRNRQVRISGMSACEVDVAGRSFAFLVALVLLGFVACKRTEEVQVVKATASVPQAARTPREETTKADVAKPVGPAPAENADKAKRENGAKLCDDICQISKPLGCKNAAECNPHCQSMAALPVCGAEVDGLFGCLIRQPIKNWECDEDGIGAIRDPFCGKEQAALAACAETNLRR